VSGLKIQGFQCKACTRNNSVTHVTRMPR